MHAQNKNINIDILFFLLGRIMNCGPSGNNKVLFFERKTDYFVCMGFRHQLNSDQPTPSHVELINSLPRGIMRNLDLNSLLKLHLSTKPAAVGLVSQKPDTSSPVKKKSCMLYHNMWFTLVCSSCSCFPSCVYLLFLDTGYVAKKSRLHGIERMGEEEHLGSENQLSQERVCPFRWLRPCVHLSVGTGEIK